MLPSIISDALGIAKISAKESFLKLFLMEHDDPHVNTIKTIQSMLRGML